MSIAFFGSKRSERLAVVLRDGRLVAVPLDLYPTLKKAKPSVRNRWRLVGRGRGVHWPDLDLDLSTAGIVEARPDETRHARTAAPVGSISRALIRTLGEADKPLTAAEIAELLEQAVSPSRLREVVTRLERKGRLRRTRSRRRAAA